jgi:hypothetical protein
VRRAAALLWMWACASPPPPPVAVIEGVVRDALGAPLRGVKVHVLKSAYTTETDAQGRYEVPFAPGAFQVSYAHERTTTEVVDLDIHVVTRFPSDVIVLYPRAAAGGIVVASTEGVRSLPASRVRERLDFVDLRSTRSWRCSEEAPAVGEVGEELVFTEDVGRELRLARLGAGGLVVTDDRAPPSVAYDGFIETSSRRVGTEALAARRFTPEVAGPYAWVVVADDPDRPAAEGDPCFPFVVTD